MGEAQAQLFWETLAVANATGRPVKNAPKINGNLVLGVLRGRFKSSYDPQRESKEAKRGPFEVVADGKKQAVEIKSAKILKMR